jgi:hypothetical protein
MTALQILILLIAEISAAPGGRCSLDEEVLSTSSGRCSLEKPALRWSDSDEAQWAGFGALGLAELENGWLGLAAADGRVQFRSPIGEWSAVKRLPVDVVRLVESAGLGLLVVGEVVLAHGSKVFLVGLDGYIKETWNLDEPFNLHSLAVWRDTYWATGSDLWSSSPEGKLLELLPGGKAVRHADIPKTQEDGKTVVPWDAVLYFGSAGERVYCVPHECRHDGPCHYGYCYRKDKVAWSEWGHWLGRPVSCGDYLLEQEFAVPAAPDLHLSFPRNRTVVRRIADGTQVAAVRNGAGGSAVCAGPNEFLLNTGDSISSFSLPNGRRRWSARVPARAGNVVTVAKSGNCMIGLTHRNAMVSICPDQRQRMVTTITR